MIEAATEPLRALGATIESAKKRLIMNELIKSAFGSFLDLCARHAYAGTSSVHMLVAVDVNQVARGRSAMSNSPLSAFQSTIIPTWYDCLCRLSDIVEPADRFGEAEAGSHAVPRPAAGSEEARPPRSWVELEQLLLVNSLQGPECQLQQPAAAASSGTPLPPANEGSSNAPPVAACTPLVFSACSGLGSGSRFETELHRRTKELKVVAQCCCCTCVTCVHSLVAWAGA